MAAATPAGRPRDSLSLDTTTTKRTPSLPLMATVQRWDGAQRIATEWNSLRKDNELWSEEGECYIYLYQPGQSQRGPSFRLPYQDIVKAGCNELLDNHLVCTWNSSPYSPSCPGGECYLYLHAPAELSREDAFNYHIDTRNFFAWMVGVPLVGTDPISALIRLKDRLDIWRDQPADNLGALISYIKDQGYCDLPEPLEASFIRSPMREVPTPRKRRESLGRLLKRPTLRLRRRTMAGLQVPVRPMSTTFAAMSPGEGAGLRKHHEIVVPTYGNGLHQRRGSADSTDSYDTVPSLAHSRGESVSSTSESPSPMPGSPILMQRPEIPSRSSSYRKVDNETGPKITRSSGPKIMDEITQHPQEVLIDALIDELIIEGRGR